MVFEGLSGSVPIERVIQFFMSDIPRPPRGYVTLQFRLSEESKVRSPSCLSCLNWPCTKFLVSFRFVSFRFVSDDAGAIVLFVATQAKAPLMSLEGSARNAMNKVYFDMRSTFRSLKPEHIIRLFGCLLLELRVIVCGSNLQSVMEACETLRHLLFPFNWQHPYIPVFAYPWMPLLRAPFPYFVGMPSQLLDPELRTSLTASGVVIADLDSNSLCGVNEAYEQVSEMFVRSFVRSFVSLEAFLFI